MTDMRSGQAPDDRDVVVAILVRNKAAMLPLYLECLAAQTFPKHRTRLYVRANDCSDDSVGILQAWVDEHGSDYKSVVADYSDIGGLDGYGSHQWDSKRCSVLAGIRQASVDYARDNGCHYFVADADNFVVPGTIDTLVESGLPVVAPMLRTVWSPYSNYHYRTDDEGYYLPDCPEYKVILDGGVRGLILVEVVHCTYFVRQEILDRVVYDDGSGRMEYVIFSDRLRKAGIAQYIDNRRVYGLIGFDPDSDAALEYGSFDADDFRRRMANLAERMVAILNHISGY